MPEVQKPQEKTASNLVTSENREAFMEARLRVPAAAPAEEKKASEKQEAADEEIADVATIEAPDKAEGAEKANGKKGNLNARFSELTEARKKAEAKAEAAEKKAADADAARVAAEAKLTPPKPAEEKAAPRRDQYQNDEEYISALTDHRVEKALAARDAKAAEEREKTAQAERTATWAQRIADAKKADPKFAEKLDASTAQVTPEMAEEVKASPVGTKMLEHFAEHPEDATRIGKLTVGAMLKEMGKLEARLEAPAAKAEAKEPEAKAEPQLVKVEISQAPAPITPIKGGSAAAVDNMVNSKGEFTGTPAQYRELRKAGRIK